MWFASTCVKEGKDCICYLYLYFMYTLSVQMHILYTCAYIILCYIWKDTDDTGISGVSDEGMWVAVGQGWQSFYYITLHTF